MSITLNSSSMLTRACPGWQADRRALNITLNSIGTELTRDDRRKLYSNFGLLYPHGHHELAGAEDFDQIRSAMEKCPPYQAIFTKLGYGESQMLDKVGRSQPSRSSGGFTPSEPRPARH